MLLDAPHSELLLSEFWNFDPDANNALNTFDIHGVSICPDKCVGYCMHVSIPLLQIEQLLCIKHCSSERFFDLTLIINPGIVCWLAHFWKHGNVFNITNRPDQWRTRHRLITNRLINGTCQLSNFRTNYQMNLHVTYKGWKACPKASTMKTQNLFYCNKSLIIKHMAWCSVLRAAMNRNNLINHWHT